MSKLSKLNDAKTIISSLAELYKNESITSMSPVLPLLFTLKNAPYDVLSEHYMFDPLFSVFIPNTSVLKCARQVSKSTSLGAYSILFAAINATLSTLYVAPRSEQTKRFSNEVVSPFLNSSLIGELLIDKSKEQSVFTKNFINGAIAHYSYAFLSADRVRGIASDFNLYDEIQSFDPEFLEVINSCMGASKYMLKFYAGTPLTTDNILEMLWRKSSMGEWVIRCMSCSHWNIPSAEEDLMDMISRKGLTCVKCGNILNPAYGEYIHRIESRRSTEVGLHIPQAIMPMHCQDKRKWKILYTCKKTWPKATFLNEICGESCDERVSLLTQADLMKASTLSCNNTIEAAKKMLPKYISVSMGVDWGGKGISGVSQTGLVLLGHRPSGKIEVFLLMNVDSGFDEIDEVRFIIHLAREFKIKALAHDIANSGWRESIMQQAGFPDELLFPTRYVAATSKSMVTPHGIDDNNVRRFYSIDKSRSLSFMCTLIKYGYFSFPVWDSWEHYSSNFLAFSQIQKESTTGADITLIERKASMSDDIGNATNIGSLAWWYKNNCFPDITHLLKRDVLRPLLAKEVEDADAPDIALETPGRVIEPPKVKPKKRGTKIIKRK